LAKRQAELAAQRLEAEVRRPADAEAYKQRTLAEAARDRIKLETEGEAFRQRGLAEASRDTVRFSTEAETSRRRAVAEAEADATKVSAQAASAAAQLTADGEAYAQRTLAAAEAEAIDVRADALGGENQALIAANKLVDMLPALVQAAATGIAGSNLTVLNGAEGVNQMVAGVVSQGLTIFETLRQGLPANAAVAETPAAPGAQ
jgi:flotillin